MFSILLLFVCFLALGYFLPEETIRSNAKVVMIINIVVLGALTICLVRSPGWLKLIPVIGLMLNALMIFWVYFIITFEITF